MLSISVMRLDLREGLLPKAAAGTPIQRIAAPEEIAALASYIASEGSGFVTGKLPLVCPRHTYSYGSVVTPAKANVYVHFPQLRIEVYLTLQQISIDGGYIFT